MVDKEYLGKDTNNNGSMLKIDSPNILKKKQLSSETVVNGIIVNPVLTTMISMPRLLFKMYIKMEFVS